MARKTFKQFLIEAPIANYDTVGDFSRASSMRHARDRHIVTNPRSVEITKKKFENAEHDFNLLFVNSAKGMKHTEVGVVPGVEWVRKNLGEDVAAKLESINLEDSITVIFTNNSGAQRMPLTAWIQAHRIMHAAARKDGRGDQYVYKEAGNYLIKTFSDIMQYYTRQEMPDSMDRMSTGRKYGQSRESVRNPQLMMKNFFQEVATFRSAREGIIRDWFEVLNELGAQYLTTGSIKFKPAPQSFTSNKVVYRIRDKEALQDANDELDTLINTMEYSINDIFSSLIGEILVM